ncbi:MAG: class I SAM-dependent DNA methyltransferase [Bacteriovorax sp.]|nr:class I SAM-dependent DNA methyltransferase [Bacteriovorax sp.]
MILRYLSIHDNLGKFSQKWKNYNKNERTGYQSFLSDFFRCFGLNFEDPNNLPFEYNTGNGFADAYLENSVIFEMKDFNKYKTKEQLESQLPQALKYWEAKGRHVPFLVLCNFHEFIIHDTRDGENHHVKLAQLESRVDSFSFLVKLNPTFVPEQEAVTKKSAMLVGNFYKALIERNAAKKEDIDLFVLQALFCLFSEDIGYLPAQTFTTCIRKIRDGEDNSANILGTLFKMMDEKEPNRKKGRFANVRYFNGPLFSKRPEIVLEDNEVSLLWDCCQLDWGNVKPEIFGAVFESSQSSKARHKDGMHFTSEEDILSVIGPCIIEPWLLEINKANTERELIEIHKKLMAFRVLDPACGSGNFLVVAYREIKKLEQKIFFKFKNAAACTYNEAQQKLGWFPVSNMHGVELNQFPAFLSKVSLWISKKLLVNEYRLLEQDLPLEELKHIVCADALEIKWDNVDVVVGNPPYIGCKQIKEARGVEYCNWLSKRFKDHNQMSDYCTYWFEKVLEDVRPGVRVGLVCTNSISQTNSRIASLDKVIINGGEIFNAISSKKWSGDAKVHVSIVNFINKKTYSGIKKLDNEVVTKISTRLLKFEVDVESVGLEVNMNKAFQGVCALGKAFILSDKEAEVLLKNKKNKEVIKRYYTASSVVDDPQNNPSEWIIDFQDWPLETAKLYPEVLDCLKKHIEIEKKQAEKKDTKKRNKLRSASNKNWWKFWRTRAELRAAIAPLEKYILVSRHTKYPIFIFVESKISLPEDSTVAIAFDDYNSLGILQSKFHTDWYKFQCSTIKGDSRYTNTFVFETFPFPKKITNSVGDVMKNIELYRKEACKKQKIGLTDLYNEMAEGGHDILKKLHQKLDSEVATCYGFAKSNLNSYENVIKFLNALNSEIAEITSRPADAANVRKVAKKASGVLETTTSKKIVKRKQV